MALYTYSVQLPDGTVTKGRQSNRDYSHAVLSHSDGTGYHPKGWGLLSMHSSQTLASSQASTWVARVVDVDEAQVVPVTKAINVKTAQRLLAQGKIHPNAVERLQAEVDQALATKGAMG